MDDEIIDDLCQIVVDNFKRLESKDGRMATRIIDLFDAANLEA
jgi:hypothetical protein